MHSGQPLGEGAGEGQVEDEHRTGGPRWVRWHGGRGGEKRGPPQDRRGRGGRWTRSWERRRSSNERLAWWQGRRVDPEMTGYNKRCVRIRSQEPEWGDGLGETSEQLPVKYRLQGPKGGL